MHNVVAGLVLMLACSATKAAQFETAVNPLQGEDIASDCRYSLKILVPKHKIRAVWVIFDRGRDVHDLYDDSSVLAFARRFDVALLLHGHCPGRQPEDHEDMNMEPARGLGPALVRALDQLAQHTGHSELSTAKLIFLGFSGAGALSARLAGFLPDRTLAAILSSPGHYEPVGIDTVKLDERALNVPELIIAGGADSVSGTSRPYEYFLKYRRQGAPWAFIIQNKSPHCCTANAKELILAWLEEVMKQRCPCSSGTRLRSVNQNAGWLTTLSTHGTTITDSFGLRTFDATAAEIQPVQHDLVQKHFDAGWLPNRATAQLWLAFENQPQHPILPPN